MQGIRMNRDEKDSLRQGVDNAMRHSIQPAVQSFQYDINFYELEQNLFVVGKHWRTPFLHLSAMCLGKMNNLILGMAWVPIFASTA